MACCEVKTLRHSVCMVTLVLALGLSVVGVAAPWWRVQEGQGVTRTEGLWQQCLRVGNSHRTCQLSPRNSGLWRAVQVVEVTSVALLLCAVLMLMVEALCTPCPFCCCCCCYFCCCRRSSRRPSSPLRNQRRCLPASFFATLLAGVTGLTGDLLYVGYSQHHTETVANQLLYYWSFALSVGGSCLALIAALAMGVTAFVLWTRRPAPKLPPHWADHFIYNPERMSATSWRYFPNRAFYHGDLRPAPFQPYSASEEDFPKVSPYDRQSLYSGNPYRGRDRHFDGGGGGDEDRYEQYQAGAFPEHAPPTLSSSLRVHYSEDSVREAYANPGFEDLEARMDLSAEEAPGEEPPNAPKESVPVQSSEVPVMDGSLPGYSSQSREHKRAGRNKSTGSGGTAGSGDPLIRPRSHSAPPSGPIKPRQQRSEGATPPLPPAPPPEAERATAETRASEVSSDVSTQTRSRDHFPADSATPSSSSRSTGPLRYVKFEDEAWATSSQAEAGTPDPTVRPIRGSRHDARGDPGYGHLQFSRGTRDPSLEREYRRRRQEHQRRVSRQWEAEGMTSAFPGQRADFRQREVAEGVTAFQRPRSALRYPRQPYHRQSFPPPSNMPEYYDPAEFSAWNRRPGHTRREMETQTEQKL